MTKRKVHGYNFLTKHPHMVDITICGIIIPFYTKSSIAFALNFKDITCKKCLAVIEKHRKLMEESK